MLRGESNQLADEASPVLDGAIVGWDWTEGRWPGKSALEFKRPGDRVRIRIPGKYQSLTYSARVRIDGLDRRFNSLVLTNGYDQGEAHWQLRSTGRLSLGLQAPDGHTEHLSDPFIDITRLRKWLHLAIVYDAPRGEVVFYVDGELMGRRAIRNQPLTIQLGDTEIGNWGTPPTYSPTKIRNLNCRTDELILFGDALSQNEIQQIGKLKIK